MASKKAPKNPQKKWVRSGGRLHRVIPPVEKKVNLENTWDAGKLPTSLNGVGFMNSDCVYPFR